MAEEEEKPSILENKRNNSLFTKIISFLTIRRLLWLIPFLIYIETASYILAGVNPSSRFLLTKTLVLTGQTWFPFGWINDSCSQYFVYLGPDFARDIHQSITNICSQHVFTDKSPGLSFIAIPIYIFVKFIGSLFGIQSIINGFDVIDKTTIIILQIVLSGINAWGIVRFYDILKKFNISSKIAIISSFIFQ